MEQRKQLENGYKNVLKRLSYFLTPAELLADSLSMIVLGNMKGKNTDFKKNNPRLYKLYQKFVNDSELRHLLVLNSLVGIIGVAGIQAMLQSLSGDDEEGALNFGQGILAA